MSSTSAHPHHPLRPLRRQAMARVRGVAALEFALLLPVLLALCIGTVEIGRALLHYERLCQSVRAAARHLATGQAGDAQRQAEACNLARTGTTSGTTNGGTNGGTWLWPDLARSRCRILEPGSEPGVRNLATAWGPISVLTVSLDRVTHTPLLAGLFPPIDFNPVSVTVPTAAP
jgi:TadE-like protein